MLSQQERQTAHALALLDALALTLAFSLAFVLRTASALPFYGSGEKPSLATHLWMLLTSIPLFWQLASRAGLYRSIAGASLGRLLWLSIRPIAYLALIEGTAVFLFQARTFSRTVFFLYVGFALLFVTMARLLIKSGFLGADNDETQHRRVLIVGLNPEAYEVARKLESQRDPSCRLVGHICGPGESLDAPLSVGTLGTIDDLKGIVEDDVVDEVIFAVPLGRLMRCRQQIAWCEEIGVTVHLKVDFVSTLVARTYPTEWDGIPMLTLSTTPQDAVALLVKRIVDITVSAVGLALISPLLVAAWCAIRLTSRGTALFRQQRVGLNGRRFTLYKFRSMYIDAERRLSELHASNEMTGPVFKIRHDPRITPVGRFLRKFSIDELPQLWNVLRGDMSLVGPRPPVPAEVRQYERWQRRRLSMKPGLTCLWQVNGRNRIGFEEWMKLDLDYIDNWSIKLDLIILLRTVPAVLTARGAH